MKKYLLLILYFFLSTQINAQKEGDFWYFGANAGLDFNSGSPVALTNSAMNAMRGCASISDANGNLLFYTHSQTVWNKNHLVMANGTGIRGDVSTTQSSLIVPLPGSLYEYYLFTMSGAGSNRFMYSIIDIRLNSGLGAVTVKNIQILRPCCEKITAVKHANNKSIWIITHLFNSDEFYAYLLTSSGLIASPIITHIGSVHGPNSNTAAAFGNMKISPDSKTLAVATFYFTEIFNFNNITGTVSNARSLLYNSNPLCSYGVEFSPDGSKLYVTGGATYALLGSVFQFNLKHTNINNTLKIIYYYFSTNISYWAIQVATDGKIYIAGLPNNYYLASINHPNDTGVSCNFIVSSVYLAGKHCQMGLPTFMQSYYFIPDFKAEPLCYGDSTKFTLTNTSGIDSVFWNFGNPASGINNYSRLYAPNHKFTDTGLYNVAVVVYHLGVPDTSLRELKITYYPTASFTIADTSQCLNENYFNFINHSAIPNGSMSYTWDFGDTTYAYDTISTHHKYTWAQTFKVQLTALSDYGCESSYSKQVLVKPSPLALFNVNDTTMCLNGNSFFFSATFGTLSHLWDYGDGNADTGRSVHHNYSSFGTYKVKTILTNSFGCKDTVMKTITVSPSPIATFTVNDSIQCFKGNSFTFSNNNQSSILTRKWWFGDGNTDTGLTVVHNYSSPGHYIVKFLIINSSGCKDSAIKSMTFDPTSDGTFLINDSDQCIKGNSFTFTNNIQPEVIDRQWWFGDGAKDTGSLMVHSYLSTGNFKVRLVITNKYNCIDSSQKTIIIRTSPSATFTIKDSVLCLNGNNFLFTKSDLLSVNNDMWYFGDGWMDSNKICNHSYLYSDSFIVKLISINKYNCIDSIEKTVIVDPSPKSAFTVNDSIQCVQGNSFSFTNNSSFKAVTGSWLWDFNDGNKDNSQNPTHNFNSTGTFDVKLIATNQYNCKDSISKQILVLPSTVASFTVNDTIECFKNNKFVFANTGNLYAPIGNWYWDFGDGITDNAKNQIHSYNNAGTFIVKLLSNNQFSCPDSSSIIIKVNPTPNATFTINNPIQCLTGNSFSFTKSDQLSVYNDLWNFGDAQTGSGKSTIHSYISAKTYNVRLIVTTPDNCSDTISQTVIVKPNPKIPIATNFSPICEDETLYFYANSSETVGYDWSADNGFSSSLQNPVISNVRLQDSGYYYVKTIMNGCESSKVPTKVIISPRPFFSFNQNQTICSGDIIILDPGFFNSYLWQDNSVNRTFNVSEPGLYKVIVYYVNGCWYSDSVLITKKCPTALFIPTAFTPNNDNINDRFEIITDNIREFDLKIYNRWGELIFHSTDPVNFWDGTYKNANCPVGVYYYQLNMRDMDGKTRLAEGTVTVVR